MSSENNSLDRRDFLRKASAISAALGSAGAALGEGKSSRSSSARPSGRAIGAKASGEHFERCVDLIYEARRGSAEIKDGRSIEEGVRHRRDHVGEAGAGRDHRDGQAARGARVSFSGVASGDFVARVDDGDFVVEAGLENCFKMRAVKAENLFHVRALQGTYEQFPAGDHRHLLHTPRSLFGAQKIFAPRRSPPSPKSWPVEHYTNLRPHSTREGTLTNGGE